jgi:hypothetical protein
VVLVLDRLEGDVLSSRADLEKALRSYDAGLYAGAFDGSRIKIDIGANWKEDKRGHAVVRCPVTINGFDPFATRRELKTYLEVFRWYCPKSDRTAVLILRSPHPFQEDDAVWNDDATRQGRNDFGKLGYGGPCPPSGAHRYVFRLYALDARLSLEEGVTREPLLRAMKGHVLAEGRLMGKYSR